MTPVPRSAVPPDATDSPDALHRALAPRARVVQPWNDCHPDWHDPPDEPDWPAPTNGLAALALTERLSPRACVVAALTAAGMALPAWERWIAEQPQPVSVRLAPLVAVRNTWRWLRGRFRLTDLGDSVDNALLAVDRVWPEQGPVFNLNVHPHRFPGSSGLRVAAWSAPHPDMPLPAFGAMACAFAAMTANAAAGRNETDRRSRTWRAQLSASGFAALTLGAACMMVAQEVAEDDGRAVRHWIGARMSQRPEALGRTDPLDPARRAWVAAWWRICRCRLAAADAATADLAH